MGGAVLQEAKQWGAALQEEVAIRVHAVIPLQMGIGREDGCCRIAQISDQQWGAALQEEVDIRVHVVIPLPMGVGST
ncbi:hypothetical protein THAOC_35349 [Thalassiosira oceanica]|uniref:Uncharacterized protein n=1 Tax=Thalassiosira oceanica TaxID=159749 RepID=K0RHA6_THAOC|nr:hypothetical protein THAOC_35349 [Thalassiosira oceanica]|eukprot:EJK46007.1 hypothetical protein THAOC_35349 [Thalassiosira oceanica]